MGATLTSYVGRGIEPRVWYLPTRDFTNLATYIFFGRPLVTNCFELSSVHSITVEGCLPSDISRYYGVQEGRDVS